MAELLRLAGVTAGYDATMAIEAIDLVLAPETTTALLGRNGVGKTTLLATIMGLTALHAGEIRLAGEPITRLETHRRSRAGIGYVPQEREIFATLTVEENLRVAERPGHWTRERIFQLFPSLAERRRADGNRLSGGEQQMLAIGRALVGNPILLLLDEPWEGLAPVIVDQLVVAVETIRRDGAITTLLVEHHAELALASSQEALVMDRGRIVWSGPSATLLGDKPRLAALIGLEAPAEAER